MKKIFILLSVFLLFTSFVLADEPTVPVMRPASPDVPSEVKSDESDYLPNIIKQNQDKKEDVNTVPKNDADNPEGDDYEEDDESVEIEAPQKTDNNPPAQTTDETDRIQDDVIDNEVNPINNDATEENIKNKNYTPAKNTIENNKSASEIKKQKKKESKKSKKEKPKYGNYNNADEDPYIQDWENSLKNQAGETDSETAEDEQPKKTYTQDDYEQAYRDMQVPTFSFVHGVDPDQYYDMKDTTWSPYPLLRLNSPLYFKTITVEPGYYLLTPREYKGDWYILFKEAGAVKYTIPVFDKSFTPATYYRDNLKELDMKKSARWQIKFLNAWGKYIRKSKRRPAIKCNIELTDLDNNFLLLDLYYDAHKYSTIFRIEKF